MARIGQDLLKLVDFPFSYSTIGIIAFLSGKSINFEKLSWSELAPTITLIGFVGTALAIIDPIGRLVKAIIRRQKFQMASRLKSRFSKESIEIALAKVQKDIDELKSEMKPKANTYIVTPLGASPGQYTQAELESMNARMRNLETVKDGLVRDLKRLEDVTTTSGMIDNVEETKWIAPEINKLVGMFYFATILLTFMLVMLNHNAASAFIQYIASLYPDPSLVYLELLIGAGLTGVSYSIFRAIMKVIKHSEIVTVHQNAIMANLEQHYLDLIRSIEKEMNLNDWAAAENYTKSMENQLAGEHYRKPG